MCDIWEKWASGWRNHIELRKKENLARALERQVGAVRRLHAHVRRAERERRADVALDAKKSQTVTWQQMGSVASGENRGRGERNTQNAIWVDIEEEWECGIWGEWVEWETLLGGLSLARWALRSP